MRLHPNQRRRLPAVACAHALQHGCPREPARVAGDAAASSRWLRTTCAFACRCSARFGEWLILLGSAGIAGFCASVMGFRAGLLSEGQYLAGVAGSFGLFAASVLIAHFGDPYEWQRSECQRALSSQAQREPVEALSISVLRTPGSVAASISRPRTPAPQN